MVRTPWSERRRALLRRRQMLRHLPQRDAAEKSVMWDRYTNCWSPSNGGERPWRWASVARSARDVGRWTIDRQGCPRHRETSEEVACLNTLCHRTPRCGLMFRRRTMLRRTLWAVEHYAVRRVEGCAVLLDAAPSPKVGGVAHCVPSNAAPLNVRNAAPS